MDIIHSHDGAGDDQATLFLILLMKFNLIAVSIHPADSTPDSATKMTHFVLNYMNQNTIPVILNDFITPNQFPDEWKLEAVDICNKIGATNNSHDNIKLSELIKPNITIIETGPLTTLANVSTDISNIKLLWVAGMFDGSSNTIQQYYPQMDGSQSWNSFIDPISASEVIRKVKDITIFPRNIDFDTSLITIDNDNGKLLKSLLPTMSRDILPAIYLSRPDLFISTKKTYTNKN